MNRPHRTRPGIAGGCPAAARPRSAEAGHRTGCPAAARPRPADWPARFATPCLAMRGACAGACRGRAARALGVSPCAGARWGALTAARRALGRVTGARRVRSGMSPCAASRSGVSPAEGICVCRAHTRSGVRTSDRVCAGKTSPALLTGRDTGWNAGRQGNRIVRPGRPYGRPRPAAARSGWHRPRRSRRRRRRSAAAQIDGWLPRARRRTPGCPGRPLRCAAAHTVACESHRVGLIAMPTSDAAASTWSLGPVSPPHGQPARRARVRRMPDSLA